MVVDFSDESVRAAIWVVASLTLAGVMWLIRGAAQVAKSIEQLRDNLTHHTEVDVPDMKRRLAAVEEQMSRNGGTTMRDAIARIELQVGNTQWMLRSHIEDKEAHRQKDGTP
jgi:hypothetical protein